MDAKDMTTGERIRMIRNMNKMNQTDFAKEIHVSTTTICQLESGKFSISRATKHNLCSRFLINPHWLDTGEGDMYAGMDTIMLIPIITGILDDNPVIFRAVQKAVRVFMPEDWRKLECLLLKLEERV